MSKNRSSSLKDPPLPLSGGDPRRKELILIIEDDPDISKMLRIYFDSQGYETTIEKLDANVVEIVSQNLPDVIILALNLPDEEGDQVYGALRTNPKTQHIPVISLPEAKEAQDKLVSIPFDFDELIESVERVISKNPSAPGRIAE
jgi:DNA-binding response OmpR family regulator